MPAAGPLYSELVGRRAFVTGGAHGIGRAIAAALGRCGVRPAIADIDVEAARRAARRSAAGAVVVEMVRYAIELLSNDDQLREMGKQARATAMGRFCSTKIVKQYEDFYRRVLDRSA